MAYLPKSKYTITQAKPGEFVTEDGKPYVGSVITTYKSESYAGSSPNSMGTPLVPVGSGVRELEVVPGHRVPTEAEYKNGSMERYFMQDLRTMKVVELTPDNYERRLKTDQPDYLVYATATWILTGSLEYNFYGYRYPGVYDKNSSTISKMEKQLPGIVSSKVLYDPAEFVKESL